MNRREFLASAGLLALAPAIWSSGAEDKAERHEGYRGFVLRSGYAPHSRMYWCIAECGDLPVNPQSSRLTRGEAIRATKKTVDRFWTTMLKSVEIAAQYNTEMARKMLWR